uniref:H15 domain-containing protein n=1 Tax=Glossina pallidipes TaxID=7398 RepID=A0A1A9ZL18_GLOPL
MAENDGMKLKRTPKSESGAELRLKKRNRSEQDIPALENDATNAMINEAKELINEEKKVQDENSSVNESSLTGDTSVATESPIADGGYGIKEIFKGSESNGVERRSSSATSFEMAEYSSVEKLRNKGKTLTNTMKSILNEELLKDEMNASFSGHKAQELTNHPPKRTSISSRTMVTKAFKSLSSRKSLSLVAIRNFISENYQLFDKALKLRMGFIKRYLKKSLESGQLIRVRGSGLRGSFRLPNKKRRRPTKSGKQTQKRTTRNKQLVTPAKKKKKLVKSKSQ